MLTKKQFDILVRMAEKGEPETQRSIAEGTGMSLGVVNKTLAQLTEAGFVKSGTVTPEGLDALEPYRVKRAVLRIENGPDHAQYAEASRSGSREENNRQPSRRGLRRRDRRGVHNTRISFRAVRSASL